MSNSVRFFSELSLNKQIQAALLRLSLMQPTEVQKQVISLALEKNDLKVCSETGSGKTLAYALPIVHLLLENPPALDCGCRALVLLPTRELARQVHKVFEQIIEKMSLKTAMLIGGQSFKYQAALLRKSPDILVATPGRLLDHLTNKTLDLNDIQVRVLDEADRILDLGFSDDMNTIAGQCPSMMQTLLFSATLHHAYMGALIKKWLHLPKAVTTQTAQDRHKKIHQYYMLADDFAHKDRIIAWLFAHEAMVQAVVFVNTKVTAQRVFKQIHSYETSVGLLHGDMRQDARNQVMGRFRQQRIKLLVATDVAARGIDVPSVSWVINYDMAHKGDDYVHRIGRTGRGNEPGTAMTLISHQEWNLKASVERYLKQTWTFRDEKALRGRYKGPKKVKLSGRAVGKKLKGAVKKVGQVKKPKFQIDSSGERPLIRAKKKR